MTQRRQYVAKTGGVTVVVMFGGAEAARVRRQAARLGITVEDLIVRAIAEHRRLPGNRGRDLEAVIPGAVRALGAPVKRGPPA